MATVSIDDDDSYRYVIRHRAHSIAGGEPKHRVAAVFDNEPEWIDTFKRLHADLAQRRVHGEDHDGCEDFIGLILEPGDFARAPLLRGALESGANALPGPVIHFSGMRSQQ